MLTVVAVFALAGIVFLGGRTEKFDAELEAKIRELQGTQEYKDAVRKLDEIRAKVAAAAEQGARSLEAAVLKIKADADPKLAEAKAEIDRLAKELSARLDILKAKADRAARDLEVQLARLTREGRQKAVEGLEWARAEAEALEANVARTVTGLQTAAAEQGERAAQALEEQKGRLQEQLQSAEELKNRLLPSGEKKE